MYEVLFHEKVSEDLVDWYTEEEALKITGKIYYRLRHDFQADGRVIKRLHYVAIPVFFEYKVRIDLRAIFYVKDKSIIYILGCIHKNVTKKIFNKRLELFLKRFYDFS